MPCTFVVHGHRWIGWHGQSIATTLPSKLPCVPPRLRWSTAIFHRLSNRTSPGRRVLKLLTLSSAAVMRSSTRCANTCRRKSCPRNTTTLVTVTLSSPSMTESGCGCYTGQHRPWTLGLSASWGLGTHWLPCLSSTAAGGRSHPRRVPRGATQEAPRRPFSNHGRPASSVRWSLSSRGGAQHRGAWRGPPAEDAT